MVNMGIDAHLERQDVVHIVASLTFAADSARPSHSYELMKLRDRIQNEWNDEMNRRNRK